MRKMLKDCIYKLHTGKVHYSESFALDHSYEEIVLHARETALGFYEKMGYKVEGEQSNKSINGFIHKIFEESSISITSRLCLVDPSVDKFRALAFCHTLYHALKNHPGCVGVDGSLKDATFIQSVASKLCRAVRLLCGSSSFEEPPEEGIAQHGGTEHSTSHYFPPSDYGSLLHQGLDS